MRARDDVVWLVVSGACATLVGIGLGRFAYAALLPAIVEAGWFDEAAAAYLGAANLAGYLIGALAAAPLAARVGGVRVIRLSLLLVLLSFALCALPAPFAWFFLWRLLAGVAGAALMVLGPSLVLGGLSPEQRKLGAAWVFSGVGVGILLSATLVPALATFSLPAAWWSLALAGALPVLLSWRSWQAAGHRQQAAAAAASTSPLPRADRLLVGAVLLAYALDAVGFVPHTVFWVDFLAREVDHGAAAAAGFWALFGLGAVAGAFLAGFAARALGWHRALAAGLALKTLAVALPVFSTVAWAAAASSFLVGALVPGIVALTSGRLAELVGPALHPRAWGWATASFAAAQALIAYAFAALYARTGSYLPLFELAALGLLLATAVVIVAPWLQGRRAARLTLDNQE